MFRLTGWTNKLSRGRLFSWKCSQTSTASLNGNDDPVIQAGLYAQHAKIRHIEQFSSKSCKIFTLKQASKYESLAQLVISSRGMCFKNSRVTLIVLWFHRNFKNCEMNLKSLNRPSSNVKCDIFYFEVMFNCEFISISNLDKFSFTIK